jgi:hypothetical protein
MICYASELVDAAKKAGMEVPINPENWFEQRKDFPYFYIFCTVQLDKAVRCWNEHFTNAKIIGRIPNEKILKVSLYDLRELGASV